MGVAYTTALAWERDRSVPSADNLRKVAELTGVSPSKLLDDRGSAVTEPQYEAWGQFLETQAGRSMSAGERTTLASMHFDRTIKASVERYQAVLLALRMT
jgi:transcriptional regulator with XRE-family HTH domain